MDKRDESLERMIAADRAFFSKPKKERDEILAELEKDPRWKDDTLLKVIKEQSDLLGDLSPDDIL